MRVDRELHEEERRLLAGMLALGINQPAKYLAQLERARVCDECECGCGSIFLDVDDRGKRFGVPSLADFFGLSPEGVLVNAFIRLEADTLAWLDIYSPAGEEGWTRPRIKDLVLAGSPAYHVLLQNYVPTRLALRLR